MVGRSDTPRRSNICPSPECSLFARCDSGGRGSGCRGGDLLRGPVHRSMRIGSGASGTPIYRGSRSSSRRGGDLRGCREPVCSREPGRAVLAGSQNDSRSARPSSGSTRLLTFKLRGAGVRLLGVLPAHPGGRPDGRGRAALGAGARGQDRPDADRSGSPVMRPRASLRSGCVLQLRRRRRDRPRLRQCRGHLAGRDLEHEPIATRHTDRSHRHRALARVRHAPPPECPYRVKAEAQAIAAQVPVPRSLSPRCERLRRTGLDSGNGRPSSPLSPPSPSPGETTPAPLRGRCCLAVQATTVLVSTCR
jgi:hypothetical protein